MLFQVEEIVTWRDWDAYRIASALHGKVTGSIMRGLWGFQRALGLFFAVFGGALAGLSLLSGRPNLLTVMGAAMLYFGIRQFRKSPLGGAAF